MKKQIPHFIFFVILSLDILFITYGKSELRAFSKPLLMPALAVILFFESGMRLQKKEVFIVLALFFSWLGDIFLLRTGPAFFLAGLTSFLIAHLMYLRCFLLHLERPLHRGMLYFSLALILCLCITMLYLTFSNLGSMLFPVIAYMTVISLMLVTAWQRDRSQPISHARTGIGATLFLFSDFILSLQLFGHPSLLFSLLVMILYAL
ncbi:MAG: lysoplasmalogenase, partial [Cyclobacteriaceae bacterium]|nr:lysoplasmalogenase [Cyclobacteriaceae bacterium]